MKTPSTLLSSLPLAVFSALFWCASTADAAPHLHLETDPATFAFSGFAAHARLSPERSHWSVGLGAYALDFPDLLVNANPNNADEDWEVRLSLGAGAFVDYYLHAEPRGWFFGAQLAIQRFHYERAGVPGEADGSNLLLMPRTGYTWFPFDRGLYLMPWFGLGVTAPIGGSSSVGGEKYDVFPVIPYGALHVGWQLF